MGQNHDVGGRSFFHWNVLNHMAVQFHSLTISDVHHDTQDTVAISLDVPEELKPVFLYQHGQYITIKIDIDGVSHRRNYSLCSSPVLDEPLTIAVKKVSTGVVSAWLKEHVSPGQALEVYPPMGNFTKELHPDHARHYLLFAGGSGITPILSIMKTILRIEPNSVVTLLYANQNDAAIMFDKDIAAIAASHPNTCRVVHILEQGASDGRQHVRGRIDSAVFDDLLQKYAPSLDAVDAFVCGPQAMMDGIIADLHRVGLPDTRIHREYFTLAPTQSPSDSTAMSADNSASNALVQRRVKIKLYGQESEFDVEPDETILSAAQRAGLDPPYACQIGACCTCRAKLVHGTASMDEREALSDDEIADGYVLTCQAHPTSDGVFADYDQ